MLETIREYGWEQLTNRDEATAARRLHAAWCLSLVEEAERELWGPAQVAWLDRLETEHDNLRAALAWSIASGAATTGLRLAAALWWFWQLRGHLSEGRTWLTRALDAPPEDPPEPLPTLRVQAMLGAAFLAGLHGDPAAGLELAGSAMARARAVDDEPGMAFAAFVLSFVAGGTDDRVAATAWAEDALARFVALRDEPRLALAQNRLGIEIKQAGDLARAETLFAEALDRWRATGHLWGIATALSNLAMVARDRGDLPRAAALFRESLDLCRRQGDQWGLLEAIVGLAEIAGLAGQAPAAAQLLGAADILSATIGLNLQPYVSVHHDQALADVRTALSPADFAAAWEAGRQLSPDEVLAIIATVQPLPPKPARAGAEPPSPAGGPPPGLTPREVEVFSLLLAGGSSREIATALSISHRTATTHIANILAKLGVDSRAAAIARAYREGWVTSDHPHDRGRA
jgi:non-specific serine/threonine protein kinase